LVGENGGSITGSFATGAVGTPSAFSAGGLVGENSGTISQSFAVGSVVGGAAVGGLAGTNSGMILNCYANGSATGSGNVGGLVGSNSSVISYSYSTGAPSGGAYVGGLIGYDTSSVGDLTDTYWDTTTSGITNLGQGAGNSTFDPGITGLTTAQFQSGLPTGFDPSVWGESADINGGLPYLIANPPPGGMPQDASFRKIGAPAGDAEKKWMASFAKSRTNPGKNTERSVY
jgi:hypothetical protein